MGHFLVYALGLFLVVSCGQIERPGISSNSDTVSMADSEVADKSISSSDSISEKNDWEGAFAFLDSEPCKKASDSARFEAKKRNYFYTRSGTYYWDDYQKFYCGFVKKKYGVIIRSSCTGFGTSASDCFFLTANILVEDKFGKDFDERTNVEARKIFK